MKENFKDVKVRLREFVEYEGITISDLEAISKCTTGAINRFMRGDGTFNVANLQKISLAFPDLSINWLLSGYGQMIYDTQKRNQEAEKHQVDYNYKDVIESKNEVIAALRDRIATQDAYLTLLTERYLNDIDTLISSSKLSCKTLDELKNFLTSQKRN